MKNRQIPVPVLIIVVLLIIVGAYYLLVDRAPKTASSLTASGTVETTRINIASELSGRVKEMLANEGDRVKAGAVLFRLDDALLKAQQDQAKAALEMAKAAAVTADAAAATAQAQYDLLSSNVLTQSQAGRAGAWKASTPGDFNQPLWYFSQADQLAAAETQVEESRQALTKAENQVKFTEQKSTSAGYMEAEKRLLAARAAYLVAKDVLDRADAASDGQDLRDAAQTTFDDASQELKDAQKAYDDALTTDGATDVLTARAELAVAQENYDTAQDRVRTLQTGDQSLQIQSAQKQLDQAKAAAEQAHLAVGQSQANLDLVDTQMGKLAIVSPADGIVLSRFVEPGEVVSPGGKALELGLLDDLTITVYVPEDRYGEISLGQEADVTVDSFPGETFKAVVTHIADQAQFTPRNVQTAEGRSTTVYAIKLKLDDPNDKLKPGMPADVSFK
jgi:HlyD family secretion protein